MPVRYNNKLAEWAQRIIDEHNGLSLRQVENRTNIAATTVMSILQGRQPNAETIIRFAKGFGEDIPTALRLAGYDDIAEVWENRGVPEGPYTPTRGPTEGGTGLDVLRDDIKEYRVPVYDDLREAGYQDLPEEERAEVVQLVKIKLDKIRSRLTTHGKKAE